MDRLIFVLVLAIPATIPATVFRWLSIDYALGTIWGAFVLIVAVGFLTVWQRAKSDLPESNIVGRAS
jgi:hypothetical protein